MAAAAPAAAARGGAAAAAAAAAPQDEKGSTLNELKAELKKTQDKLAEYDALPIADRKPFAELMGKLQDKENGSRSLALLTCGAPSISTVAWWRWCAQGFVTTSASWRAVVAVVVEEVLEVGCCRFARSPKRCLCAESH